MQDLCNHKRFFELSGLISGFLSGTLSQKQHEELDSWLSGSEEHRALFSRICAEQTMRDKIHNYRQEEVQSAFHDFLQRRRQLTFRRRIYRWVACAVLILLVGGGWLQWQAIKPDLLPDSVLSQEAEVPDSSRRPVLTLASGVRIVIPEGGLLSEDTVSGQQMIAANVFSESGAGAFSTSELTHNTVSVPPMCDFQFIISDGTKVWMNAASSLRYPVKFAADSRTIYVSGEVYLEVAKDTCRPFSVVTDGMRIEVLGTCFNVRAYPHEQETRITLAEGRVAARVGEKKYTLIPGNQLSLEESSEKINIRSVDVDEVLSWKRGFYVFKKCNLAEVASTLQCWYDVEIVLKGEVAARTTYTGVVNKEETIEVFLARLEKVSDVKYSRVGNVVMIQ